MGGGMGGGNLLGGLTSGFGGAGAEASGIGGGIFSPQGLQGMGSSSPSPMTPPTGLGDFGSGPNPAGAAPPPTSIAQQLNGGPSPQMNALQLAFGQSTVDPLTGGVVPAGSTTGNNVPAGATPQGVLAATQQLASAKPTQLPQQQVQLASLQNSMSDAPQPGFGQPAEEDLPDLPPRPSGQPPAGRDMPKTGKDIEDLFKGTDFSQPMAQGPGLVQQAFAQGVETGADATMAKLTGKAPLPPPNPNRYPQPYDEPGDMPLPQPPGNQMIQRPPPVPVPGIDVLRPNVPDNIQPEGPRAFQNYQRDQNLDVPQPPNVAPGDRNLPDTQYPSKRLDRELFPGDEVGPYDYPSMGKNPREPGGGYRAQGPAGTQVAAMGDWLPEWLGGTPTPQQQGPPIPRQVAPPVTPATPPEFRGERLYDLRKNINDPRDPIRQEAQRKLDRESGLPYEPKTMDVDKYGWGVNWKEVAPQIRELEAEKDRLFHSGEYSVNANQALQDKINLLMQPKPLIPERSLLPQGPDASEMAKPAGKPGRQKRSEGDGRVQVAGLGDYVPESIKRAFARGDSTVREPGNFGLDIPELPGPLGPEFKQPAAGAATGSRGTEEGPQRTSPYGTATAMRPEQLTEAFKPAVEAAGGDPDAFEKIVRESVAMPPRMQGGTGDYREAENARVDRQLEATPTLREATRRQFELSPEGRGRYGQPATQGPAVPADYARGYGSLPPPPELPGALTGMPDTSTSPPLSSPYGTATAMTPDQLTSAFHPTGKTLPGEQLPSELRVSEALRSPPFFGPNSPAARAWDTLTGVPERQGPPIPTAGAAATGGTPGVNERTVYQLPGEGGGGGRPAGKPTQVIQVDKDGNVTFSTEPNPFLGGRPAVPPPAPLPPATTPAAGAVAPPTLDITKQPQVKTPDGKIATVRTMSIGTPEGEVLIPTVSPDGKLLSPDEAKEQFRRTGNHLGIYKTPADATRAAETIHQSEENALTVPREPTPVPAPVVRIPSQKGGFAGSIYPQGPVQPIQGFTPEESADLAGTNPDLQRVVARAAKDNPGLFRLNPQTKTMRTQAEQDEMVKRGWSQTRSSYHQAGNAVDLVPINPKTMQPDPDYQSGYPQIERAMKDAAKKEGVPNVAWGGRFENPDRPHWEITGGPRGTVAPEDYIKPDVPVIKGDTGPANWLRFSAQQETGGAADPYTTRARAGGSATGKYQYIDDTWVSTVDAAVPEASTMSREQKLALRQDPDWQESMHLAHTKFNVGKLEAAGLPATNANLLAAHQMGVDRAIKVIQNPSDPIANYVSPLAVARNPGFRQTGASYLASAQAKADEVFPEAVSDNPAIRGTPEREILNSLPKSQRMQGAVEDTRADLPSRQVVAQAQAAPPAGTVQQPGGRVTTPGGKIIPQTQPLQVPAPPQKLPDPKVDPSKYRKAVEELTPAQVVRMTEKQRMWGRLAGIFGGMANGKSWGDMMMGGAAGGMGARAREAQQDVADKNLENERDFQYRQRKAALEGELMKVDQQNAQGDVNAANINAERAYEAQKYNTLQAQGAANANEAAAAQALNAEREEGKPKVTVTDKGITTQRYDPVTGQTEVKHTPTAQVDDDFKRVKEASELIRKGDLAAQAAAYDFIGEKYGSAGIKLQMLGDLSTNSRYAQVFGGNKQLVERLKQVAQNANKLLPPAAQTDAKQTAEVQEEAVKAELIRLYQSGQLGEGWIRDLQMQGHPGALKLQPQRQGGAPATPASQIPSGLGQGTAFENRP